MNILDFSIEELEAICVEKETIFAEAKAEHKKAQNNLRERRRLEELKAKLGDVSSDDIAKVIESITLSVNPIKTEENVQLT